MGMGGGEPPGGGSPQVLVRFANLPRGPKMFLKNKTFKINFKHSKIT
jgi:hypothetical protein